MWGGGLGFHETTPVLLCMPFFPSFLMYNNLFIMHKKRSREEIWGIWGVWERRKVLPISCLSFFLSQKKEKPLPEKEKSGHGRCQDLCVVLCKRKRRANERDHGILSGQVAVLALRDCFPAELLRLVFTPRAASGHTQRISYMGLWDYEPNERASAVRANSVPES